MDLQGCSGGGGGRREAQVRSFACLFFSLCSLNSLQCALKKKKDKKLQHPGKALKTSCYLDVINSGFKIIGTIRPPFLSRKACGASPYSEGCGVSWCFHCSLFDIFLIKYKQLKRSQTPKPRSPFSSLWTQLPVGCALLTIWTVSADIVSRVVYVRGWSLFVLTWDFLFSSVHLYHY